MYGILFNFLGYLKSACKKRPAELQITKSQPHIKDETREEEFQRADKNVISTRRIVAAKKTIRNSASSPSITTSTIAPEGKKIENNQDSLQSKIEEGPFTEITSLEIEVEIDQKETSEIEIPIAVANGATKQPNMAEEMRAKREEETSGCNRILDKEKRCEAEEQKNPRLIPDLWPRTVIVLKDRAPGKALEEIKEAQEVYDVAQESRESKEKKEPTETAEKIVPKEESREELEESGEKLEESGEELEESGGESEESGEELEELGEELEELGDELEESVESEEEIDESEEEKESTNASTSENLSISNIDSFPFAQFSQAKNAFTTISTNFSPFNTSQPFPGTVPASSASTFNQGSTISGPAPEDYEDVEMTEAEDEGGKEKEKNVFISEGVLYIYENDGWIKRSRGIVSINVPIGRGEEGRSGGSKTSYSNGGRIFMKAMRDLNLVMNGWCFSGMNARKNGTSRVDFLCPNGALGMSKERGLLSSCAIVFKCASMADAFFKALQRHSSSK